MSRNFVRSSKIIRFVDENEFFFRKDFSRMMFAKRLMYYFRFLLSNFILLILFFFFQVKYNIFYIFDYVHYTYVYIYI